MLTREREEQLRAGLFCLVPKEGVTAPSCHEKTRCDCEVLELFAEIDRLRQELDFQTSRAVANAGLSSLYKLQRDRLKKVVRDIDNTLRVPAAEYVPEIGDVFTIIDSYAQQNQVKGD